MRFGSCFFLVLAVASSSVYGDIMDVTTESATDSRGTGGAGSLDDIGAGLDSDNPGPILIYSGHFTVNASGEHHVLQDVPQAGQFVSTTPQSTYSSLNGSLVVLLVLLGLMGSVVAIGYSLRRRGKNAKPETVV